MFAFEMRWLRFNECLEVGWSSDAGLSSHANRIEYAPPDLLPVFCSPFPFPFPLLRLLQLGVHSCKAYPAAHDAARVRALFLWLLALGRTSHYDGSSIAAVGGRDGLVKGF